MSHHIVSQVYKRQTGKMQRTSVLALLADKASDDGCGIWASKQTIADEMGATKQTIITIIDSLLEDGLLIFVGEKPCANGYTCEYRIDIDVLEALPLVAAHARRESRKRTGQKIRPVENTDPTGQENRPHRSKKQTLTSLEPSLNPSPPAPRRGEKRVSGASTMPDQWIFPEIGALPEPIAALARQWPEGAYQTEGEAFHQHWRGRGARRADWAALWAARVQHRHAAVMRDGKAGVRFAALPAPAGDAANPVVATAKETDRSAELHEALRDGIGKAAWEQWFARCALIFEDCGLTVVTPSAFHASHLEGNHRASIEAALSALGSGVDWTKFVVGKVGGAKSGGSRTPRAAGAA